MTDLLLRDVVLGGERVDVLIEGNTFTAIAADLPVGGQRIIEGGGDLAITPAFYNSHTHGAMTLLRGFADDLGLDEWLSRHIWPAEAALSEQDVLAGTRLAIVEMIRSGTVFFNDMYWYPRAAHQAAAELGVRAQIGQLFLCGPDGRLAPPAAAQNEALVDLGADPSGRVGVGLAPHAVYTVSDPVLRGVADLAASTGQIVHIHASETAQEVADCRARTGRTPIEHLDALGLIGPRCVLAHCVHLSDRDRSIIADRGAHISHQPVSNMKLCNGSFDWEGALAGGCRVALGTDGAASNNNLSMFDEMKVAALSAKRRSGRPTDGRAVDVWSAATASGAAAFGIRGGRIEVGFLADALLVDLRHPALVADHNLVSNLVYSADPSVIRTVICDGRILMLDRAIQGQDEIVADARASVHRLRARLGRQ